MQSKKYTPVWATINHKVEAARLLNGALFDVAYDEMVVVRDKKAEARMVTSAMCGIFHRNPKTRAEFLEHSHRPIAKDV